MKTTYTLTLLFLATLATAQNGTIKKFQVGVSYSVTSKDENYANPFNVDASYMFKEYDNLKLNAGLRVFYLNSSRPNNFTDRWGINPNVGASYTFENSKFQINLAVGYYYDQSTFTPTPLFTLPPSFTIESSKLETHGITISPRLSYFIVDSFYIHSDLTLLFVPEEKTQNNRSSNNTFLNIGVGVAF